MSLLIIFTVYHKLSLQGFRKLRTSLCLGVAGSNWIFARCFRNLGKPCKSPPSVTPSPQYL